MKILRLRPMLLLFVALGFAAAFTPRAGAQGPAALENGFRNDFRPGPAGTPGGEPAPPSGDPLLPAYQAQRQNGTAFGGFTGSGYGTLAQDTSPSAPAAVPQNFPRSAATASVPVGVELRSSVIARPLALFSVSYNFGDVIPPPAKLDGTGQPLAGFYRDEPLNARLKTIVMVTGGVTTGIFVVDALASDVDGVTQTVSGGTTTTVSVALNPQFYWSKHARKVYATQPGTITIKWRESATTSFITETYVIAAAPAKPERTIYWTENGFAGPLVEVPAGRLNQMNIVYNTLVPKDVAVPYAPWFAGVTDFTETDPAKKRYKTFYYETNLIHAYNVEGRVFVEYLGNPRGDGTSEQKGIEIVNVVKEAVPGTRVVDLGEEVGPLPATDDDGNPISLNAKIVAGQGLAGQPYVYDHISSGGTKHTLYAIRETQPGVKVDGTIQQISNEVLIYWMETAVLDLQWPKQYLGYVQQWPADPAKYSVYARPDSGVPGGSDAALATAVQLDSANNPALVHQDDPANAQARLNPDNKFYTKVTSSDPTNRALLRYTRDEDIWFERVYSQLDPYYRNPQDLLRRTVTAAPDSRGVHATGFANISNVQVVDAATGARFVEGVDYTVNYGTGEVARIDRQFVESVASLGVLNAGDTVMVRLFCAWNFSINAVGVDWEARSLSLTTAGATVPFASADFKAGHGDFTVFGGPVPEGPWTYDAAKGTWGTSGSSFSSNNNLTSPEFVATQTGEVTLRLRHRYNFETRYDGGQIRYSVNGGAFQLVAAFSSNPYPTTLFPAIVGPGIPPNTGTPLAGQPAFTGKSAGYDFSPPASVRISFDAPTLPFSSVPGVLAADIGTRIEPDPGLGADQYGDTEPVYVGYIHQQSGTAFDVEAYKDPFAAGFDEASKGAIIGVNALPGNNQLEVWWYRKSVPRGSTITATYWPSFVRRYALRWPDDPAKIVLADNAGSGDLPSLEAGGKIYTQNDSTLAGYNPNEEHALMLNGRAWALRDDLNVATSSQPFVLLHYTEADARPAMRVFKVERGVFDYPAVAGTILQSPMPLPLLPPPLRPDRTLASYEMSGVPDPFVVSTALSTTDAAFAHYQKFTWTDRKGSVWVYRGPHGGNAVAPSPTLKMRYFYATLPGFHFPNMATQPPVGTITPYLRSGTPGAWIGDVVSGTVPGSPLRVAQDVTFRPQWPDSAPELRVGETLTLPKLGLPQVRGQSSAEFIYQQSVATDPAAGMASRRKSARLIDPTRAKVFLLSAATLPNIPSSVNTSLFQGKTYFPNLPPHLSGRLYFDPATGPLGSLIFKGVFMDEQVGEKYLQLNVMSAADLAAAKELAPDADPLKSKWDAAINGLATTMETFVEDPARRGTFIPLQSEFATPRPSSIVNGVTVPVPPGAAPLVATAPAGVSPAAGQRPPVAAGEPAEVFYGDTAVDSYAVSASGGGSGFVVLATGNGLDSDFTPAGEPVSLQVFKVEAPLYRGELKVINSANPLDEKLTLQHTGDFAGHPEEYDFEWRYAPPVDGLPPKLYSFVRTLIAGDAGAGWRILHNPLTYPFPFLALDYTRFRSPSADVSALPVVDPGLIVINDGNGTAAHGTTLPNALLRRTFSATRRPLRLFLSFDMAPNDGAVVYLNGSPAAAWHAPGFEDSPETSVPATAPAFAPLPLVFEINPNAMITGAVADNNVITVELFTSADAGSTTSFNLRLEGSQEVENLLAWLPIGLVPPESASTSSATNNEVTPPTTGIVAVQGKNRHTIQGSSILTLSDNWIVMRYRARSPGHAAYVAGGGWSQWTEPQLAEGWIKRVLAGINPFQQRVKDLFNHETNTSVSLVEQAGKRWEGNIALNLENINQSGLIEIYETVLRRGKDLSITGTPAINYGGANDALLLAAGYLSDLYMILGNEAYADAANSTIAFNAEGAGAYGDVATALFSFKGQLATVLDEELCLMRGRDDSLLPGTQKAPVYNRLIWNYTRGIDSGEAIYALNYNIKDRVWDYSINPNNAANLPADGIISAADAAISYPQGHGDAYGHYLTALTGYYGLLNNPNFSWTPRIEAVLVLGTPVSVDYQDERKFAAAAVAVARSASRTLELTYRKDYSAAENAGWSRLHDSLPNAATGRTRSWGTDDWAVRGGQGALFHWATANSLLPAVDPDPGHTGIQKIDRTTVPELAEIAAQAAVIQQTLDNADARLNPLGLAPGALTFDISPSDVDAGKTHFEQIQERAIAALQNAVSAFNNAKGSTQFLRQQEDTLADQRNAIEAQEQAYTNQLIELYGTPYTDDIGPGKTYSQGYAGPDLLHAMYLDLPEIFHSTAQTSYQLLLNPTFVDAWNDPVFTESTFNPGFSVFYTLSAEGELVKPAAWSGRRVSPGRMQTALSDMLLARQELQDASVEYSTLQKKIERQVLLYESAVSVADERSDLNHEASEITAGLEALKLAALLATKVGETSREAIDEAKDAVVNGTPFIVGPAAFDPSWAARLAAESAGAGAKLSGSVALGGLEIFREGLDFAIEKSVFVLEAAKDQISLRQENKQLLYEIHATLEELKLGANPVDAALRHLDQARRDVYSLQAEGDRIQLERLVFRQHAAAVIQGYRTRDFAFRAFRDEALERYHALFDLAARYTYLAARAYDYETGLLDAAGNPAAAAFFEKIVKARALGVVSDGQPQFAGASTGDPGLSGVLAALAGDWSVAKTRLGFNNPDPYSTTFSLRKEKFRLLPGNEGDLAWKDKLAGYRMDNILDDPDVKRYCMQVSDPNGNSVPGIVIPFSSTIATGYNFFGQPLAGGDHGFTPSSFATKIRSSGIALSGYIGMDSPSAIDGVIGEIGGDSPPNPNTGFSDPNALSATPYIYLIPAGSDSMRSPPLGDTSSIRTWAVEDQAIPLPFNIAGSDYSAQPAWVTSASLTEPAFTLRKHQAFRAIPDGTNFQDGAGFTNARLIGRSAWNSQWKIVIPGNTLLNDPNLGLQTFLNTVKDIKLHLETYSYSGN